ncbi:MAG TPA: YcxB family protein [Terricaulis sp.]|nr:YcxB family protein [Terricaulis sp.]
MEPIIVRGVMLSQAERAMRRSPWPFINRANGLNALLIHAAPIAVLVFLSYALDASAGVIAAAVLIALVPLVLMLALQSQTWRAFMRANAATPSGAIPDDWRIDEATVRMESSVLQIEAPWRGFADVIEADVVFHFVLTPAMIFVLPKRALSDADLGALRGLIAAARVRGDIMGIPR